jgi:hypothetical protein
MKTLTNYASRDTFHVPDSGCSGFRPHSQRRDREGVAPSSLTLEFYWQHNRRGQQNLSSSVIAAEAHPVTKNYSLLLMNVHLVLVTIHAAVVLSSDFHQVHFVKKENDRGMDV